MDQLFFTISFEYEIIPRSLHVDLSAEIEMIDMHTCIVNNIRRVGTSESPLLPVLKLTNTEGKWMHADTGRESHIASAIGEAVDRHLKQHDKSQDKKIIL